MHFPPLERKWGNDLGSSAAWKVAAIHDKDGSVGGVPNSYILINDGVYDSVAADAQACAAKQEWNATVCKGDVGRLSFGNGNVGFGAPAPAARPAGPPPPPVPVVLSRNGREDTVTQNSNVRSGTEIRVKTERPALSLNLTTADGQRLVGDPEPPGFAKAAAGTEQNSLDTLRAASTTSMTRTRMRCG